MATTTVSGKGQVTLPAQMLRDLGVLPGTKLLVVPVRDGMLLLRREGPLADALAGATGGTYGDVEEYVRGERDAWT